MHNLQSQNVLMNLVPHHLKQDEFIVALTKGVEKELREVYDEAHAITDFLYFMIESETLLDVIAYEKMVEFYFNLSLEEKQEFVRNAKELKSHKGTVYALEKVLEILGFSGIVNEWFEYDATKGYFRVTVDLSTRGTSEEALNLLTRLIEEYKRKSSWLDTIYTFLNSDSEMYYGVTTQLNKTIEIYPG